MCNQNKTKTKKTTCFICEDKTLKTYLPITITLGEAEVIAHMCAGCFVDSTANENQDYVFCQVCDNAVTYLVDYQDQIMCEDCSDSLKDNDENREDLRQDYYKAIGG